MGSGIIIGDRGNQKGVFKRAESWNQTHHYHNYSLEVHAEVLKMQQPQPFKCKTREWNTGLIALNRVHGPPVQNCVLLVGGEPCFSSSRLELEPRSPNTD